MPYPSRVLVVARRTAASDDLRDALRRRAEQGPARFTLLLPAPTPGLAGRTAAEPDLAAALEHLRAAGLEVTGVVGDHDPLEAVAEAWRPGAFEEVIVSTLPGASSKWMLMDFPHRIAKLFDVPVRQVTSRPPPPEREPTPPRRHEREPLGPLAVLGWSHPRG